MEEIIKKAEELRRAIKAKEREIDNPALVLGMLSELDFFMENLKSD